MSCGETGVACCWRNLTGDSLMDFNLQTTVYVILPLRVLSFFFFLKKKLKTPTRQLGIKQSGRSFREVTSSSTSGVHGFIALWSIHGKL